MVAMVRFVVEMVVVVVVEVLLDQVGRGQQEIIIITNK